MSFLFNSKHSNHDKSASQKALSREAEHLFEATKLKLFEKLDVIKQICIKEVIDSAEKNHQTLDPLALNTAALEKLEKVLAREIEKLRFDLINPGKPFAPFICETLEVPANIGFNYGANIYNAKHNMIMCSPSNSSVHFYDAEELTPMKQRKKKQLNSSVVQMSYCEETDTHLMGCAFGDIYTYNATLNKFKKILKEGDSFILAITYLDENNFAFSSSKSGKLFFGNIKTEKAVQKYSKESDAWYLHHMPGKNLLFAGLANGKIAAYKTNGKDGRYPLVESVQAHRFGKYVTMITSVNIKGKEYIITGGNDHTIKIWHIVRGRLRLLKVIQNNEDVSTIVYLENYQMIASTHHKDYIKFFKVPSGKLEATINLGLTKARNIFLMKDKNKLGVADLTRNVIKMVQLHAPETDD